MMNEKGTSAYKRMRQLKPTSTIVMCLMKTELGVRDSREIELGLASQGCPHHEKSKKARGSLKDFSENVQMPKCKNEEESVFWSREAATLGFRMQK